jgi:hypothetical protein
MTDDQLERLTREVVVRRLIDGYADACDHDDAVAVASLFAADGVLRVRDREYRGDDIVAFYAERLDLASLHFTTGLRLTDRPDGRIASTCGFAALEMPADGWAVVTGRYDDVVRIADGDARFVERRISVFGRRALGPPS